MNVAAAQAPTDEPHRVSDEGAPILAENGRGEKGTAGPPGGGCGAEGRTRQWDAVTTLRLAYLALAAGLMGLGGILVWLGTRRPRRPAGRRLRIVLTAAALLALAGLVAVVVLEALAARPW